MSPLPNLAGGRPPASATPGTSARGSPAAERRSAGDRAFAQEAHASVSCYFLGAFPDRSVDVDGFEVDRFDVHVIHGLVLLSTHRAGFASCVLLRLLMGSEPPAVRITVRIGGAQRPRSDRARSG